MLFTYSGPVTSFNKIIANNFIAQTEAVSLKKAKTNIISQFKIKNGYSMNKKIELPGKIICHKMGGTNV